MKQDKDANPSSDIPRYINCAFKHAKLGEERRARSFWKSALNSGYIEDGETKHELEKAIKAGLREHGLVPPIAIRRRSETGSAKPGDETDDGAPKGSPKPLDMKWNRVMIAWTI